MKQHYAGLKIAAQAASQFLLVSAQTVTISSYGRLGGTWRIGMAFLISLAISSLWWSNARNAATSDVSAGRYWYAFGCATGSITGLVSMSWLMR